MVIRQSWRLDGPRSRLRQTVIDGNDKRGLPVSYAHSMPANCLLIEFCYLSLPSIYRVRTNAVVGEIKVLLFIKFSLDVFYCIKKDFNQHVLFVFCPEHEVFDTLSLSNSEIKTSKPNILPMSSLHKHCR